MRVFSLIPLVYLVQTLFAVERVILIGLDGAGSFNQQIETPNIRSLLRDGVACKYARAQEPTWSGQNWGSILTGVIPSKHGVTNSNINNGPYRVEAYPTVFKKVSEAYPEFNVASLVSWSPINVGLIEEGLNVTKLAMSDDALVPEAIQYIKENGKLSKFIFIDLSDIDYAGHNYGWMSATYQDQYKKTDQHVGAILEAIKSSDLESSSLVLITADHGGYKGGHGGKNISELQVLFGARGPGIKPKELANSTLRNMDAYALTLDALQIPLPNNIDARVPNEIYN